MYLCEQSIIPIIMDEVVLKEELKKREVFYKETYNRDFLVHLLEMDILLRSQRIYMSLNK